MTASVSGDMAGMLMALVGSPPLAMARIWSATAKATLTWASAVEAPKWGVVMILSCPSRGFPVGGSLVKTSTAAPATFPSATALARAASLMIPPRAQFTMRTPSFMILNSSSSIRLRVSFRPHAERSPGSPGSAPSAGPFLQSQRGHRLRFACQRTSCGWQPLLPPGPDRRRPGSC